MNGLVLAIGLAISPDLYGQCVSVTDGDTIRVLVDRREIKVRLAGIDAPEKRQAFGTRSMEEMAALVKGKMVMVRFSGLDKYQRALGVVFSDQTSVNREMVARGMAWHYVRYSRDRSLAAAKVAAREQRLGLWGEKEPVPPWEWRKNQKRGSRQSSPYLKIHALLFENSLAQLFDECFVFVRYLWPKISASQHDLLENCKRFRAQREAAVVVYSRLPQIVLLHAAEFNIGLLGIKIGGPDRNAKDRRWFSHQVNTP